MHKQEFLFLASDDLLDEFLKAYYSKNHAPREIIVPSSFDVSLEEYFKNLWHHTVEITIPQRGLKKDLLDLAIKNAYSQFAIEDPILIGLQQMLKLDVMPMTIDAIDISNYGESVIVGACVQFKNKEPYKAAWRTYTIRGDFGQDDFRSIHEVITRRYERMPLPDLLIIDGGALQLKFALKALEELGHDCSVVGLAKREETIVFADGTTLRLDQKQAASKLILRIRDAVHSFGLKQSRKQFSKAYKHSELDEIPGIGAITKFKLLSQFGSLDAIKKASYDELSTIIGIRAQGVFDFFHKK